ncbi:MAG: GNAT family N-acetyltransferase [Actinomycetota bacterium]
MVVIRDLVAEDEPALYELFCSIAEEGWISTEPPVARSRTLRMVADHLDPAVQIHCFTAELDGRFVGYLGLFDERRKGVAAMGMMLPEHARSRGVGSALMDEAIDRARAWGCHRMTLGVWPHNERALGLYRKMGFVEEGRRPAHARRANGELWDLIEMGRAL